MHRQQRTMINAPEQIRRAGAVPTVDRARPMLTARRRSVAVPARHGGRRPPAGADETDRD